MENHLKFVSKATAVFFLSVISVSVAARDYDFCSKQPAPARPTIPSPFWCRSGKREFVPRSDYCNNVSQCSDGSDEANCYNSWIGYCQDGYVHCSNIRKCIPSEWKCDGYIDCRNRDDEEYCHVKVQSTTDSFNTSERRQDAIQWIRNRTVPNSATRKWGPLLHKLSVALYLSDPNFLTSPEFKEITYELSIQLLSRINKKKIQGIRSSELASFLNAFLVTCIDPRDFYGWNLVEELRSRVNKQNYTNPYVLLALCNAGDPITETDVKKLTDVFRNNHREIWTDMQAVSLMALSCARNQTDSTVDEDMITELAMELKKHQYRNGTVENLHTTLLVMQALYAAEPDEDTNNFDEMKALSYIVQNQKSDGSFGNFLLTYYALPVLNCQSLVDISNAHCSKVHKDEETALFDLVNYVGPKIRIRYSIWLGVERDLERTLSLRVPANTSFYRAMEIAAELDSRYKFDYIVKNLKPYITAVFGLMDNPESEQFWFPYRVKDGKPSLIQESTADIIPQDDDHVVMWYRKGSWVD